MSEETRSVIHGELRTLAKQYFEKNPKMRSVMLAVAQYWCDEAEDAVHERLYASERSMPLWPHRCADSVWEDDLEGVAGEACSGCGEFDAYMRNWDDNGEDTIAAIAPYCHEVGSQEEPSTSNYLPYALARRVGDDVEIEVIGRVQRPRVDFVDDDFSPDPTWQDPRALDLLQEVATASDDDGPRRVLADYLLERENPRGEYIGLCLEAPSGDVVSKRDELLAEHRDAWLFPMQKAAVSVRWSRGFPVEAELAWHDDDVRGPVWTTIEKLYVHGGPPVLDSSMRALRTLLGEIDEPWVDALAAAKEPWAIETLEITRGQSALAKVTTLPKLRNLIVVGELDAALVQAPWWKQLERLTLVGDAALAWYQRHRELGVPWLAIAREHMEPTTARGWELAFGPGGACEITQRGWTPEASLDALAELLPKLPPVASIKLVRSEFYEPSHVDIERLQPATSIPITL